jgi:hypothetical protein
VDTDNDSVGEKLRRLREARNADRQSSPPFPIALGEANPHGEAWLIDDQVAVRGALCLPGDYQIKTVRQVKSPKDEIHALRKQSNRAEDPMTDVLEDIARGLDHSRCMHARETGFDGLLQEVRTELAPCISSCGDQCKCGDACTGGGQ